MKGARQKMSRVNKYRAWNIKKKIMCYDNEDRDNDCWYGTFPSMVMLINQYLNLPERLKEYEYMQYIGVKDKNGKEIYERDIVRTNSGRLCKVVWFSSPQYQGWDLEPIEAKNPAPKEHELWKDLEVIGNVYENADFLKEVDR